MAKIAQWATREKNTISFLVHSIEQGSVFKSNIFQYLKYFFQYIMQGLLALQHADIQMGETSY